MTPTLVFDTNVIVSALLSSNGLCNELLELFLRRKLKIAFDDRIECEYRDVLHREHFDFDFSRVQSFFSILPHQKKFIIPPRSSIQLSDPSDLPFLEVALLLDDPILVTGNIKHFPLSLIGKVKVLSPREAWELLQTRIEMEN